MGFNPIDISLLEGSPQGPKSPTSAADSPKPTASPVSEHVLNATQPPTTSSYTSLSSGIISNTPENTTSSDTTSPPSTSPTYTSQLSPPNLHSIPNSNSTTSSTSTTDIPPTETPASGPATAATMTPSPTPDTAPADAHTTALTHTTANPASHPPHAAPRLSLTGAVTHGAATSPSANVPEYLTRAQHSTSPTAPWLALSPLLRFPELGPHAVIPSIVTESEHRAGVTEMIVMRAQQHMRDHKEGGKYGDREKFSRENAQLTPEKSTTRSRGKSFGHSQDLSKLSPSVSRLSSSYPQQHPHITKPAISHISAVTLEDWSSQTYLESAAAYATSWVTPREDYVATEPPPPVRFIISVVFYVLVSFSSSPPCLLSL